MVWLFIRIISFAKIPVLSLTLTETNNIAGAGGGGSSKNALCGVAFFGFQWLPRLENLEQKTPCYKIFANNDTMWWHFFQNLTPKILKGSYIFRNFANGNVNFSTLEAISLILTLGLWP